MAKIKSQNMASITPRVDIVFKKIFGVEENKDKLSILEVMNFNFDEREIYEGRLKWIRMEESALRKVSNDSRAEGKAEGLNDDIKNLCIRV